jgi:hypothetical protein
MMKLTPKEIIRRELKNVNRKIDAAERECKRNGPLSSERADEVIMLIGWRSALGWVIDGVLTE